MRQRIEMKAAQANPDSVRPEFRTPETGADRQQAKRRAMCSSLVDSAKKCASLAAFLGGLNACGAGSFAIGGASYVWDEKGRNGWIDVSDWDETYGAERHQAATERARHFFSSRELEIEVSGQRLRRQTYLENPEREGRPIYKGFEAMAVDAEKLDRYLRSALPRHWADAGAVSKITFDPRTEMAQTPGLENRRSNGKCQHSLDGSPATIEIQVQRLADLDSQQELEENLFTVLTHELAHVNDWRSPRLTPEQSVWALDQIVILAVGDGRIRFEAVEAIKPEGRNVVPTEYFASLMEFALQPGHGSERADSWASWTGWLRGRLVAVQGVSPESAEKNSHFVAEYLKISDPSFKPWEAAKHGKAVAAEIVAEHGATRLGQITDKMSEPRSRSFVKHLLSADKSEFDEAEVAAMAAAAREQASWLPNGINDPVELNAYGQWQYLLLNASKALMQRWDNSPDSLTVWLVAGNVEGLEKYLSGIPVGRRDELVNAMLRDAPSILDGSIARGKE